MKTFWAKVDRRGPDECWPWTGAAANGRGQLRVGDRRRQATHVALELAGRPLKLGENALHTCDNPICVNAAHLYGGSPVDNSRDARMRLRSGKLKLWPRACELFAAGVKPPVVARELKIHWVLAYRWRRAWKSDPSLTKPFDPKRHPKENADA